MGEFHFLRPYILWAFIPLILALLLTFKRTRRLNEWSQVCDTHLLRHLLVPLGQRSRFLSCLFCSLAGSLMIISASGPTWKQLPDTSYSSKKASVIVLDLSSAMYAEDTLPSRLQRAKYKVQDLLNEIHEGQVGLVVFTKEPFLVSPLTLDTHTLSLLLPNLSPNIMPVDGTNIKDAIRMAAKLITQAGFNKGTILLLTANKANNEDIKEARVLAKQGIHLAVMGFGTKLGAPIVNAQAQEVISRLDETSLKQLARAGNGIYTGFTADNHDINVLLKETQSHDVEYQKDKQDIKKWKDDGRLLLIFLLPIVLLSFRRGWLQSISA